MSQLLATLPQFLWIPIINYLGYDTRFKFRSINDDCLQLFNKVSEKTYVISKTNTNLSINLYCKIMDNYLFIWINDIVITFEACNHDKFRGSQCDFNNKNFSKGPLFMAISICNVLYRHDIIANILIRKCTHFDFFPIACNIIGVGGHIPITYVSFSKPTSRKKYDYINNVNFTNIELRGATKTSIIFAKRTIILSKCKITNGRNGFVNVISPSVTIQDCIFNDVDLIIDVDDRFTGIRDVQIQINLIKIDSCVFSDSQLHTRYLNPDTYVPRSYIISNNIFHCGRKCGRPIYIIGKYLLFWIHNNKIYNCFAAFTLSSPGYYLLTNNHVDRYQIGVTDGNGHDILLYSGNIFANLSDDSFNKFSLNYMTYNGQYYVMMKTNEITTDDHQERIKLCKTIEWIPNQLS